jgi:ketosteroid isomerase-like protein
MAYQNTALPRRALACAVAKADANAPPADLAQAVREYDVATTNNDVTALSQLIADDYMLVNSDSSVENKSQYLADFHLPGFHIEPYTMEEPILRVWDRFALTGGLLPLTWIQDGARHRRRLRIVHAWKRAEGRWQIAYTQVTGIPEVEASSQRCAT